MQLNHDPDKRMMKAEEKRKRANAPSAAHFFRPAKPHMRAEKMEAAALMTSLAAERYVSINQMQR